MADSYSNWVMTTAFVNNSQAALNAGNKIEWVSIKSSDDTHALSDLAGFNDTTLSTASIKQTANISSVTITGNTVTVTGLFNSNDNTADYYIRTLFLVAKYNGTEFLAGTAIANTSGSAFRMPAASNTEITEFTARPQISVTNTSAISATVNPVASATNERVDGLEDDLQGQINDINTDKHNLWNKLSDYVTKATAETILGVKTFTQTIVGSITGNAGTATKLETARKLNGTIFDGTSDITIPINGTDEVVGGVKTFNKQIIGAFSTRFATFTDFTTVAANMNTYAGQWRVGGVAVLNSPTVGMTYYVVEVIPDISGTAGVIRVTQFGNGNTYYNVVNAGLLTGWSKVAKDETVMHLSGDETVNGNKLFLSPISVGGNGTKLNLDSVELSGNIPYIDFHFANDAADYTSRIIEIAKGALSVNGVSMSGGNISGALIGNADTSTKLKTPRKINGTNFDGTADINVNAANDANLVHNTGAETVAGNKTFTGIANFSQQISGGLATRDATFTDLATVYASMNAYSGNWRVTTGPIVGSPVSGGQYVLTVVNYGVNAGQIIITTLSGKKTYITGVSGGMSTGWILVADDATVVHNTGTETVAGNKMFTGDNNFSGATTLKTGNYGLRVTTTGIQKTSDNGATWVNI
jgi:hypothetical protein